VEVRGKEDAMLIKCIAAYAHMPAIATYWSEIATFSYPLAFNAPVGVFPLEFRGKSLVLTKLESWGYQAVKIF